MILCGTFSFRMFIVIGSHHHNSSVMLEFEMVSKQLSQFIIYPVFSGVNNFNLSILHRGTQM